MNMPLVFIHGWGQSARIWRRQSDYFRGTSAVHLSGLPGHGGKPDAPAESWVERLAGQLPDIPCILVGWSLGGLLAMQLALNDPERIAALVLVSTTPCFRRRPDWPHGCADDVWTDFEQGIAAHPARTMRRFFALMMHGDVLPRGEHGRMAREVVDHDQPPTPHGLQQGLVMLDELDLRPHLGRIVQPALIMHGDNDAVIPVAAGHYLSKQLPHAAWLPFTGCGHAPFLSQAEKFNEQLEAWCRNISAQQG